MFTEASYSKIRIKHVLIAALCLHVVMTTSIYLVGVTGMFPRLFDVNGTALSFTPDSVIYRLDSISLTDTFHQAGASQWLHARAELHTKIYSACFLLFSPLFGFTILATEPINALSYLLILYLIFSIGQEVFQPRVGLLAAGIVTLWPSLLLHTTQWLKDQLFIAAILILVLVGVKWLNKVYSWKEGLATGALGGFAGIILWHIKSDSWELIVAVIFLITIFLTVRLLKERKFLIGNMVGAALLLVFTFLTPRLLPATNFFNSHPSPTVSIEKQETPSIELHPPAPVSPVKGGQTNSWTRIPARITLLRQRFIGLYPDQGSNIDTDIVFNNVGDIIYYLPRAMTIGFFAPFPKMWFATGTQTGRLGHLLGGLETLAMYLLELMALAGLWHRRNQLSAWLLFLIAALSVTVLALVVTNVGALYRMRYVFWMLLIIVGTEGIVQIFSEFRLSRKAVTS